MFGLRGSASDLLYQILVPTPCTIKYNSPCVQNLIACWSQSLMPQEPIINPPDSVKWLNHNPVLFLSQCKLWVTQYYYYLWYRERTPQFWEGKPGSNIHHTHNIPDSKHETARNQNTLGNFWIEAREPVALHSITQRTIFRGAGLEGDINFCGNKTNSRSLKTTTAQFWVLSITKHSIDGVFIVLDY